ncbi:N-acetyltransferase domain-containing protein [Camponotus japonicus]
MLKIFRFRDIWVKCHSTRTYAKKIIGGIEMDINKTMEKLPSVKPPGQPPKIWKSIEKVTNDGKSTKFTIQEIPEDRYEDAVQHMCTYFLADEPTCQCLNAKDDPIFVQDHSAIWRLLLTEGISIAAFTENPNGGKPIIAGMNALGVDFKNHKNNLSEYEPKSVNSKNTFAIISDATKIIYEHYGVDKYLYGIGLSVDPAYRGYGLGKDILKIRDLIGREYIIPATCTVFTSIILQKSAKDAGFELLTAQDFIDIVDENGKQYFPGIKSKTLEVLGKRLS